MEKSGTFRWQFAECFQILQASVFRAVYTCEKLLWIFKILKNEHMLIFVVKNCFDATEIEPWQVCCTDESVCVGLASPHLVSLFRFCTEWTQSYCVLFELGRKRNSIKMIRGSFSQKPVTHIGNSSSIRYRLFARNLSIHDFIICAAMLALERHFIFRLRCRECLHTARNRNEVLRTDCREAVMMDSSFVV